MIDLHTHSTASDGQYSPAELMQLAAKNHITTIALTDHDTVSGITEAQAAAEQLGLRFIAGIEISTTSEIGSMHILGYNIDIQNAELIKTCEWFANQRLERGNKIFKFLEERNMPLARSSVEKYSAGGLLVSTHFARAMVDAGYIENPQEAFDKYFETPEFKRQTKREKLSPEKSIELIRSAGGLPVLAHPIQLKADLDKLRSVIKNLTAHGLAGIECYYSTNTPELTAEYLKIAEENNLYPTVGSDFHGEKVKPDIKLGTGKNNSLNVESLEFLEILEN